MAKNAKKSNMPAGFEPLRSRLGGFYIVREGNAVQGFLRGSFVTTGDFGPKKTYRVELSDDGTSVMDEGKERVALKGELIGVDQKGFLKSLENVEAGREVFIQCTGQEAKAKKKGQSPAWLFDVGVVPI